MILFLYNTKIDRRFFRGTMRARLEARYGAANPPSSGAIGAEAFSLWMTAVCPLPESEKSRLLASKDTAERLRTTVGCFNAVMRQVPCGFPGVLQEEEQAAFLRYS